MKHRYTNKLPPKNANETCRGIKASKEKNLEDLEAMTKEELIQELVKAWITEARLKRLRSERRWSGNIEEYLPLPAAVRCRRIRILYELFSAPKQQINFFFSNSAVAVHEIELAFYLHIVHFKDCKVFFAFCHRLISKGYGIVFHHHIGDHRKVADRNDPMKAIQRKPVF